MKSIMVLTATRAEYGLLNPIIRELKNKSELQVRIVATGAHLSPEFGLTYKEIEKDGYELDRKIEILLSSDTPSAISKSMGLVMIGFADYFAERRPNAILVLGDRYETLAVCCAAMNERIPIVHLYGGETTEGAVDEAIRHAITKMSYLHLTSTEEYRRRVIQLGENPERVFTVGAVGIENAKKQKLISKEELEKDLGFSLDKPYAVVTFHPVTLEGKSAGEQCREMLHAFDRHPEMKYIISKANADSDDRIINKMLDEYAGTHENVLVRESLGMIRYLSALKYADMVIGNSSSGLVEAPSFQIPTINIGDRQKGRLQAESIINCKPLEQDICSAFGIAQSVSFKNKCRTVVNPYGDGLTSPKVVKHIMDMFHNGIDIKKKFYNIEVPNED
ncbi:UDP-N-acetylglucosamine 2-epimerase [Holdemania filiformis]|uniref:UDP-N-acetylglucosamine 2-epimerase (Hydrolyzing) n=1 Tax=Holdemania filiformis TaxID=61171 RepID=A0A412G5K0_9FIRM|nr:UDP-N-acetylglucosamine 2-epimerase [Holdemania filiformis]MBS5002716.1 UDP-N-acetylglucosamine 2-epimerase (hydrolyzing) [Holdemania filiformis]RGR76270.1 UDP-N-acetylglucosamine 2-epimerase (hydrolyzing) [Holdemania filiformis]